MFSCDVHTCIEFLDQVVHYNVLSYPIEDKLNLLQFCILTMMNYWKLTVSVEDLNLGSKTIHVYHMSNFFGFHNIRKLLQIWQHFDIRKTKKKRRKLQIKQHPFPPNLWELKVLPPFLTFSM